MSANSDTRDFYLNEILEICSAPLYNPLEVGFRHSPLTIKEQNERLREALRIIEDYAKELQKLC